MTEQEYIDYFEGLAMSSRFINHNRETNKAFFVISEENQAELIKALRSDLSLPALLLDQYTDEYDTQYDNCRLNILGGFSILVKLEVGDTESVRQARDTARQIAQKFLNRIRKDLRSPEGVLAKRLVYMEPRNQGDSTPIFGNSTLATGWGYDLTFWTPVKTAVDSDDWADL